MSRFDARKDYYSILGAGEDASAGDIERLYKRKAVEHHPDRGGDEEQMKSLNEAYGVLKDERARRAYDAERRGSAGEAVAAATAPRSSPGLQVEAAAAQSLGAFLFIGAGLVLVLLVRIQWIWFLWPLVVLALALVAVGVLMAHGAIRRLEDRHALAHSWFGVTLEVMFWTLLVCGGYGIYLVLR
ncbi:MAG TPA: J domain-containing protein [Pyrinomonadaceae bacterium]|nr:J domain-containing protein [Pyrinomonadaceae bacterium]